MEILRSGAYGEALKRKNAEELSVSQGVQRTSNRGAESKLPEHFTVSEANKARFSEGSLKHAVDQANEISVMFDRGLRFEYRREADVYQVSVIDTAKDEVVRKIPPDEVVRFIERIKDMFGAMLDVQA